LSGSCGLGASGESLEEGREVLPREAPLERLGSGLIVILEGEQRSSRAVRELMSFGVRTFLCTMEK
jgi:hypothetical protein